MQPNALPVIFLSHGPPTCAVADNPTTRFWSRLPGRLPAAPKAVLCVSAHWDTQAPRIAGGMERPPIQHDFYGFPPELYHVTWSPRGSGDWAERIADALAAPASGEPGNDGFDTVMADPARPLDHGVWVPLRAAWPKPPMPVLQLSLCTRRGGPWHLALGRRLAPLRDEGVLIVASGGITHNLARLAPATPDGTATPWARQFVDAFESALAKGDEALLTDPWRLPHGQEAHPTLEHYYPMLVALGAAADEPLLPIHRAWTHATLALYAYATPTLKAEALPVEEVGEEEKAA